MDVLNDLLGSSEAFLDAVPTAIIVHNAAGQPCFANRRARHLFDEHADAAASAAAITAAAQIYVADTDVLYPLEQLPSVTAFGPEEARVEAMEIRRPDGTVHLEVRAQATYGPDGKVRCVVHNFVDASERKNTDADLRLTESLAKAVATAPGFAGVLETSLHEICQLTGWSFGQAWLPEPTGRVLRCRYVWHDDVEGLAEFHVASRSLELTAGHGLAGRVWVSKQWEWNDDAALDPELSALGGAIDALPDSHRARVGIPVLVDGDVVAVLDFFVLVGGSQDQRSLDRVAAVVSRVGLWMSTKGAEDAIGRSEQQFRKIAESATDAIVFAGSNSQIIYMNPSAERMFGYTADEVLGHSMTQLVHDRSATEGGTDFERYSQVGHGDLIGPPVYLAAVSKDGAEFPVEMNLTSWQQGSDTFLAAIVRDSSDRVQAEQRLEDALGHEREVVKGLHVLDGLRYTVLQTLAHDLRSPIAAVLTLTGILRAYADTDIEGMPRVSPQARAKMLSDIERSVRKMERLLNDLINSDPDQPIEARRTRCDIGDLVSRVLAESELGRLHPIHTQLESVHVNVDAAQVERIIDNLLNNAAKHVDVGVAVWAETAATGDGVLISIDDAGAGIPPDMHEQIFEAFRRGDEPTSPGLGLGLSLVSRFAQVQGGRAWVQDRPGGGAAFRVYLPDTPTVASAGEAETRVRVLLVDDDPILGDALATLISFDAGLDLVTAPVRTGQHAIDAVTRHHPDVVLMDIDLIGAMNGYQATSKILEIAPATKVVITSGASDPDRAAANSLAVGASSFLPKTLAVDQLVNALRTAARKQEP